MISHIAGGVAGIAGIFVGHPFDSLKVRMQMMSATPSGQVVSASTTAASPSRMLFVQSSQFGSLWKGIGAPVAMAAVVNASVFFTYGGSMRIWDDYYFDSETINAATAPHSLMKTAVCGGVAGIVSSFIICPTEHIKTKLQTQRASTTPSTLSSNLYRGSLHATNSIISNHGIKGLYRGFFATIARQSPAFAVFFASYDRIRNYAINNHFSAQYALMASITAGGFAGSLSWAAVYPMDLIKSRIQALPLECSKRKCSIAYVTREVVSLHGWRALYRGFGITVFRAFPVNAIIFPMYELTLKALRSGSS
ncbi:hypothetical protein ACHAXR_010824 [Thalassiosira sp. AJA248-18]